MFYLSIETNSSFPFPVFLNGGPDQALKRFRQKREELRSLVITDENGVGRVSDLFL